MHWPAQQHQKCLKRHRRHLKCIMIELLPWLRKATSKHLTKPRALCGRKVKRCLYEWKCAKPFRVYQKASKRASAVLEKKNKLPHRWNQDETITLPVKHVEVISQLPVDVSQWLMMMWPLLQPADWIVWCSCLISALIQPHDENLITVKMDNEPNIYHKSNPRVS